MTTKTLFARGFPAAISILREDEAPPYPELAFGLCALLRSASFPITYCEADVISGQATQFIYARPELSDSEISFVPPVDTLFRALGVVWKEVTPSDPSAAFSVMKQWIGEGAIILARFNSVLLIYGYDIGKLEDTIVLFGAHPTAKETRVNSSTLAQDHWRYPFDEANLLLRIEHISSATPDLNRLCHLISHRAVKAWRTAELASCASGAMAYDAVIAELSASPETVSPKLHRSIVLQELRRQLFRKLSLTRYFERMAPRFGGAERNAYSRAAFCYAQCHREWASAMQFLDSTNHERAAADKLAAARDWEHKAVSELLRVIS